MHFLLSAAKQARLLDLMQTAVVIVVRIANGIITILITKSDFII